MNVQLIVLLFVTICNICMTVFYEIHTSFIWCPLVSSVFLNQSINLVSCKTERIKLLIEAKASIEATAEFKYFSETLFKPQLSSFSVY